MQGSIQALCLCLSRPGKPVRQLGTDKKPPEPSLEMLMEIWYGVLELEEMDNVKYLQTYYKQ